MMKKYLVLCALAVLFALPLSASAHLTSYRLESTFVTDVSSTLHPAMDYSDDGKSCDGKAKYAVPYLKSPTSDDAIIVFSQPTIGRTVINGHIIDPIGGIDSHDRWALTNGTYDLYIAYSTSNTSPTNSAQFNSMSWCERQYLATITINDPALDVGTYITLEHPTYDSTQSVPSAQVPFTTDYGFIKYVGIVFEPANSDPLGTGGDGSLAGGFTFEPGFAPWDWYLSSVPGDAFSPKYRGTYTFAILPQTNTCMRSYSTQTLADCAPEIVASANVYLDNDIVPPVVTRASDGMVEASSTAGVLVNYVLPTATDDVEGAVPVSCSPPPGSLFAVGTTTVACSASDSAGNTATSSFGIVVNYVPPPVKKPKDDCDISIPLPGSSKLCISIPIPEPPKPPKAPVPPKVPKLPKLP